MTSRGKRAKRQRKQRRKKNSELMFEKVLKCGVNCLHLFSTRKSPKPNRRSMDAEKIASHPSPKHEPKKMTSHGKKGWTSKSNIKEDFPKNAKTVPPVSQDPPYKSTVSGKACGPNANLRKGPNDDLLLTDYVTWNGPDPDIRKGPSESLAKGPRKSKGPTGLSMGGSLARGPDPSNQKGPAGLATGSLLSQKKSTETRSR